MSSTVITSGQYEPPDISQQPGLFEHLRVAIVHHWFVSLAGGERVVATIAKLFPHADVFTLFLDHDKLPIGLRQHKITTSFLDKIPGARKLHRHFLPLYPLAVEMLDLSGYDLIISSDSGPMKGVVTDPHSKHLCYCYSPMRYLWDAHSAYFRAMPTLTRRVFRPVSHYVRNWDFAAAQRVDSFIAISRYIARRIRKYYRRDSIVIYPPVDTSQGYLADSHDDYYLTVGRLVPYKRTDILIDACCQLGRKLLIVGDGMEIRRLKKRAAKNIEFVGEVDDRTLRNIYARCRAFLFAAEEDFGLVPLEAQSYGRPVIAFGKGGALETVIGRNLHPTQLPNNSDSLPTGIFFPEQTAESLAEAILAFESQEETFIPEAIRRHACQFDTSIFLDRMRDYLNVVFGN